MTITVTYSDDDLVTTARLFYKPSSADRWSSKAIIDGTVSFSIPANSEEPWYYYVIIDDQAGNGPIGSPSNDGSRYYVINIVQGDNNTEDEGDFEPDNDGNNHHNASVRHALIEVGTKIVCSECPKISTLLHDMYKSGDSPFYYVSLPMTDTQAIARLTQYNIYGYPTMYIDGGYQVIMGGSIQKTDLEQKLQNALSRPRHNISIKIQALQIQESQNTTVLVSMMNRENTLYKGYLRVYITEIVSTGGEGNTPQRFLFNDLLFNENVIIPANQEKQVSKTSSFNGLDPENVMIIAAVFSSEKNSGYSQPPDKNPFDAYFVDTVAATTVVEGGNIPPEIGIQSPQVNYIHRFGKPVRKSVLSRTILFGQTMIVTNVSDDSAVTKVEFYIDEKLKATIDEPPYLWMWNTFTIGKHTLLVKVYDDKGKMSSASLEVVAFIKWKGPISNLLTLLIKPTDVTLN